MEKYRVLQDLGEYNRIEELHNLSRELQVEPNLHVSSYLGILLDGVYLRSSEGQVMTHIRLLDSFF